MDTEILHNFPSYMETPQKQKVVYKSVYEMIDRPKSTRFRSNPQRVYQVQPTYYMDWRTPLMNIWRAFTR